MTYLRAETSQIDAWANLGNNITWDSLFPYFKKSEYFQVPTQAQSQKGASYEPDNHGFVGPLAVGWPDEMVGNNFSAILNSTFDSIGLPWNGDPNNGSMRGYNVFPWTIDRSLNVREDAARAYYYPFSLRPNLDVYLNAFVERLTWEAVSHESQPFASGVVCKHSSGKEQQLSAKKEVILSAGSLRSPLILELSGVGNPKVLEKFGIEVKVNLPFVGENLLDQTTVDTTYNATENFPGDGGFVSYFNVDDVFGNNSKTIADEIKQAIPAYAKAIVAASGNITDLSAVEKLLNVQHKIIFEDKAVISEILVNRPKEESSILEYWGLMPVSRGGIHINSSNASAPAAIQPNYFMLDWDVKQLVGTAQKARSIANTAPLSNFLSAETLPGLATVPANSSNEIWTDWLKSAYRSNFHYVSTAAMLSQELGGVVDSDHLVYGTANVRVVDASVVPFQVSGHLTSTLYALAERAADVIKARYA
ncbi:hypothetical protein LTR85_002106 [Meristemomyces frigidus]|nr:hypothetical protein LTR85_002106 [Meristemomyces frigidus]